MIKASLAEVESDFGGYQVAAERGEIVMVLHNQEPSIVLPPRRTNGCDDGTSSSE